MIEVGVRELKSGLSGYLRRVAKGERVRVTMRGKPLADITPAVKAGLAEDPWWRLVADGTVTPAAQPRPGRPPPLGREAPSATAVILAEREADAR